MNQRLQNALQNITIIVQQARMTAQEHAQLADDLKLIREELTAREEKKNKKIKAENQIVEQKE